MVWQGKVLVSEETDKFPEDIRWSPSYPSRGIRFLPGQYAVACSFGETVRVVEPFMVESGAVS